MRGESMIAIWGLALAAIMLLVMGGAGTWAYLTQRDAHRELRRESLGAVADLLSQSVARLLASSELSSVRVLIADAARERQLARCRLLLGDGAVLADADPSSISGVSLPAKFSPGPPPAPEALGSGYVEFRLPITVPGRGLAFLDIAGDARLPMSAYWQVQGGIGLIGAAGLSGLLLVYRRMRERLRGLAAVREALMAMAEGEDAIEALSVSANFGAEAVAWNAVLAERERLRTELTAERARESLSSRRDAGAELGQACDALWQGFVVIDDQLRVKYANGAAAVFLRAPREKVIGARIGEFIQDEGVLSAIGSASSGRVKTRTSIEVRRGEDQGGGILRFSVRPVRRDDAGAAVIVIEDVTQQRVADDARNGFVAQATHELRTPLTNIRAYAETLSSGMFDDPKVITECYNVITKETRRLSRLIEDILSVSQLEVGSIELHVDDVDLKALLSEAVRDVRQLAEEKNIDLQLVLPPKRELISGDRDKLAVVVNNLLGNALKYTPKGGTVIAACQFSSDAALISVKDNGIGIAPEDHGRVFEKFQRANDPAVLAETGTGIGLYTSREIVRRHGGEIEVISAKGEGSTFMVRLPHKESRAAALSTGKES